MNKKPKESYTVGSSAEIERLYQIEKKRIKNSSVHLEEERLKAYLRMLAKRKAMLKEKKDYLKKNEKSLSKQAEDALLELKKAAEKHDLLLKKLQKFKAESFKCRRDFAEIGRESRIFLSKLHEVGHKVDKKKAKKSVPLKSGVTGVMGAKAAITSSDAKLAALATLATKAVVLKEPDKPKEIVVVKEEKKR